jgi:hypothetical protein
LFNFLSKFPSVYPKATFRTHSQIIGKYFGLFVPQCVMSAVGCQLSVQASSYTQLDGISRLVVTAVCNMSRSRQNACSSHDTPRAREMADRPIECLLLLVPAGYAALHDNKPFFLSLSLFFHFHNFMCFVTVQANTKLLNTVATCSNGSAINKRAYKRHKQEAAHVVLLSADTEMSCCSPGSLTCNIYN